MPAAASILRYYRFFRTSNARYVLDYGAGKLRNALFLAGEGFSVLAADVPEQLGILMDQQRAGSLAGVIATSVLERTRLNVDLVISNFVFNIIQDETEKQRYLQNTARNLRPGGFFLVEVRCSQNLMPCSSGCHCRACCSNCIKTYTIEQLDKLIIPSGFRRKCHYYRHCALAAIYQLDDSNC